MKPKKWRWSLLLWLALIVLMRTAFAEGTQQEAPSQQQQEQSQEQTEQTVEQQIDWILQGIDLSELEEWYVWAEEFFEGENLQQALDLLTKEGLSRLEVRQLLQLILQQVRQSFAGNWKYTVQILIIVLVSGIFANLRKETASGDAYSMAEWAAYVICCVLAAWILAGSIGEVRHAAELLSGALGAITPILMLLLTSMGNLSASAVLSPLMAALTEGIFRVVATVILPMIMIKCILDLASGASGMLRLDGFSKLLAAGVKWMLGIVFIVFLGVTALKGIAGASIDGVYFKTAKFTVDKMVPVIGGMFSDTLDTLMACCLIVKNAVGIIGLLALCGMMLTPLCGLIGNLFLLKLAAAVAGIFEDGPVKKLLERLGECISLLFAALLSMLLMAFIFIAVVMGAADAGIMMR